MLRTNPLGLPIAMMLVMLLSVVSPVTNGVQRLDGPTPSNTSASTTTFDFEVGFEGESVYPYHDLQFGTYDLHKDRLAMLVQQSTVMDEILHLPGIYIYEPPATGVDGAMQLQDMTLKSNWSLPTNSSVNCHLKTDGTHHALACAGEFGTATRVDFDATHHINLTGEGSYIVTWDDTGSIVGLWSTDEGDSTTCGLGQSFDTPYNRHVLHNGSHYILARSVSSPDCSTLTLQDGTNLSCSPMSPGGSTNGPCTYVLRLSFNGTVLGGLYSRGTADINIQSFSFRTPTSFQLSTSSCPTTSFTCVLRNLDGTTHTSVSQGTFSINQIGFTDSFEYIRSHTEKVCTYVFIKDIIIHENYSFYMAHTNNEGLMTSMCGESFQSDSGSTLPSTFLDWMGEGYQNLTRNNSAKPVTIGYHDHVGSNDWVISYWNGYGNLGGSSWAHTTGLLGASNSTLFMHGWSSSSTSLWPSETFGGVPVAGAIPGVNGMLLDMNGDWNELTPRRCLHHDRVHAYVHDDWYVCDTSATSTIYDVLALVSIDGDGDGTPDRYDAFPNVSSQSVDADLDGYGDAVLGYQPDACQLVAGNSTEDVFGCPDADGDGWSNGGDSYPIEPSQHADSDYDGFGDNSTGFRGDACPATYGLSFRDAFGCPDADADGWSNTDDAFPNDASQWNDTDGDGYGDQLIGFQGDACPATVGLSTKDRFGCTDTDLDGWSDAGDAFPNEATQWSDRDFDGYGDNQSAGANLSDAFPGDTTQWNDTDGDGHGDNAFGNLGDHFPNDSTRWQDSDLDGVADEDDAFVNDVSQWNDSDGDGYGDNANGNNADAFVNDSTEWKDTDGDGVGNNGDAFPTDGTQWADADNDGYGDNPSGINGDQFPNDALRWSDRDGDGYSDQEDDDAFPLDPSQWADRDGDGFGDNPNGTRADAFPDDGAEWSDSDGDGYGDNTDAFPVDATQWNDTDNDGYGDNPYGSQGDRFPDDPTRWKDTDEDGVTDSEDAFPNEVTQNADRDGDGYGDNASGTNADRFPDDPNEWVDSDGDGVGDNADAFVFDPTQTNDTDGDGYGDNPAGSYADAFPNDPDRWGDTDKDGYANQDDAFPNDNTQWADRDGDGYGDNPNGTNADAFPDDTTQHVDRDGDGYGDNPLGTNADAFPSDTTQWSDRDGDGYGDNPTGQQPDRFPDNPTQYIDEDGDGLGDNPNGTEADPSLNDMDNDGYTDDVDILPNLASPGDMDNDGVPDEEDAFPADFREAKDSDGDGEGDNADVDDDNDGWTDIDEIREGADPFSSSVQPVEGFEVLIPSTQVSLGAWDIIGILTGVPLALWVGLGLMTRTQRGRKFEDMLNNAGSIEELNLIAADYESSLMWKMLGPHQGLRLERMRTEIERDKFAEQMKSIPEINTTTAPAEPEVSEGAPTLGTTTSEPSDDVAPPDASVKAQKTDENGYEWYSGPDGSNFYRPTGSGDAWKRYDG